MNSSEVARYWEGNAETWTRLARAGYDHYRDALNTPEFLRILPEISGLTGLDIGCGEGGNTRKLAGLGAIMHGIDIAPTFLKHAKDSEEAASLGITYRLGDATALEDPEDRYDFATAFMSLMDVPEPGKAISEAFRVLKPGGFLQFSILHPCFVPPVTKNLRDENGISYGRMVGDYFRETDGEVETWKFNAVPAEIRETLEPFQVPRFHRPLSTWVGYLCQAGFRIEAMNEPRADEETAARVPEVEDTRCVPIFLQVRARKVTR
jgi:ubiquinone/menaquinone biosynthesis C-methylase UbiE